jgi:ribosomal protein S18 acetylase RimI-like enzyme
VSEFEIREATVTEIEPLRTALLWDRRDTNPPGEAAGRRPEPFSIGGYRDGRLAGFATMVRRPLPGDDAPHAWEVTGIGVDHGHRGYGLGGAMLQRCLDHAAASGAKTVWAQSPTPAVGFFERFGFLRGGDLLRFRERRGRTLVIATIASIRP